MYSFDQRMASAVDNTGTKGWLVSILELGAWAGVLCTGYLADKISRKYTIVLGQYACFLRGKGANLSTQLSVYSVSVLSSKPRHSNHRRYMVVCSLSLL